MVTFYARDKGIWRKFDEYLEETAELQDRDRRQRGLSYDEAEWEAFQSGWNAAKKHFGVQE